MFYTWTAFTFSRAALNDQLTPQAAVILHRGWTDSQLKLILRQWYQLPQRRNCPTMKLTHISFHLLRYKKKDIYLQLFQLLTNTLLWNVIMCSNHREVTILWEKHAALTQCESPYFFLNLRPGFRFSILSGLCQWMMGESEPFGNSISLIRGGLGIATWS